jgi:hypothetical protein
VLLPLGGRRSHFCIPLETHIRLKDVRVKEYAASDGDETNGRSLSEEKLQPEAPGNFNLIER